MARKTAKAADADPLPGDSVGSATAVADLDESPALPAPADIAAEITLERLLDEDRPYHQREISLWLEIPERLIEDVWKSGRFVSGIDSPPNLQLSGRRVIGWIRSGDVPYRITEAAVRAYRALHPAPARAPAAAAAPAASIIDAAAEIDQGRRDCDTECERHRRETAFSWYLRLLSRADCPEAGDAMMLADVMHDLELSPEQMAADLQLIREARDLAAAFAQRGEAARVAADLHARRMAFLESQDKALQEFDRQLSAAVARSNEARDAGRELLRLRNLRPEFFEGDPPQLKEINED